MPANQSSRPTRIPIIRYRAHLKPFAAKLRRKMTRAEVKLWKRLKTGQIRGFDFDRQHMAGQWILDFYCKRLRLAIELDGEVHAHLREKDQRRQRALEAMGIRFLRFWNAEVMNFSDVVVAKIEAWVRAHEHEAVPPLPSAKPTPNPSQEGSGQLDPARGRTSLRTPIGNERRRSRRANSSPSQDPGSDFSRQTGTRP